MIEIAALPHSSVLTCLKMLPIADDSAHRFVSLEQAKLSRAAAQLAAFALFPDRVQSGYEITSLVQPSVERDDAASLETRGKSSRLLNRAIRVRVSRWIARSVARCVKVDRVPPLRDRAMSNLVGLADVTLASSAERSIHPRTPERASLHPVP